MKELYRTAWYRAAGILAVFAALSLGGPGSAVAKMAGGSSDNEAAVDLDKNHPRVKETMAVQNRHSAVLMAHPDVVGIATGLDDAGQPAVLLFTRVAVEDGVLPGQLEGKSVVRRVTGEIRAMKGGGGAKARIDPKDRFIRPVPIGVSTGNAGECSAGTIGARVKDAEGNLYTLSNNHVYALENFAPIGSQILQPGRYDTRCGMAASDVIGSLAAFVPIDFVGTNTVDAALAATTAASVGQATPADGYGLPLAATTAAVLNAPVQKYGRTTSLTKGTVTGINATIRVGYSAGTATFTGQIAVTGKAFLRSGDSGSLLVTDPARQPVGLLFAGNNSGSYSFANPIDPVLASFGVTIDGE